MKILSQGISSAFTLWFKSYKMSPRMCIVQMKLLLQSRLVLKLNYQQMTQSIVDTEASKKEAHQLDKINNYAKLLRKKQLLKKNSLQTLLNFAQKQAEQSNTILMPKHRSLDKERNSNSEHNNQHIQRVTNYKKRKSHITDTVYLQEQYKTKTHPRGIKTEEIHSLNKNASNMDSYSGYKTQSLLKSNKNEGQGNKKKIFSKLFKHNDLKDSYFEQWINGVILQHCAEQQFNLQLKHAGLKKYSVDRVSLINFGVSQQNVSRILKSLYIYSMGFNNSLKEMIGNNSTVRLNVWRIFQVLIEYCSDGDIKTMLNQLQKEKQQKISGLMSQITKYQNVLLYSKYREDEQTNQIDRLNKTLVFSIQQLQLESQILKEDKMSQERIINQQVALRLLFQNKINDLYRLHREHCIKHEKLLFDFQISYNKIRESQQLIQKLEETNKKLREQLLSSQLRVKEENLSMQIYKRQNMQLKEQIKSMNTYNLRLRGQLNKLNYDMAEKELLSQQIKANEDILRSQIKMLEQNYKKTQHNYMSQLSLNKDNYERYDVEINQINNFIGYKDSRNRNKSELVKEIQYLTDQLHRKEQQIGNLQESIKEKDNKHAELLQRNELILVDSKGYKNNLEVSCENIKELKEINSKIQDQIQEEQSKNDSLSKYLKTKESIIEELHDEIDRFKEKQFSYQKKLGQLESRFKIYEKHAQVKQSSARRQIDNIRKKFDLQMKNFQGKAKQFKDKQAYFMRIKENYDLMVIDLNRERFQRQNLDIIYKHALTVIQSLQQANKELNHVNSTNQSKLYDQILNRKRQEMTIESQRKSHETQISKLKNIITMQQSKQNKADFIHPMIHQDLTHLYDRLQKKYTGLQAKFIDETQYLRSLIKQIQQKMMQSIRQKIAIKQEYKLKSIKIEQEVQYYKHRNDEHRAKMNQLEQKLNDEIREKNSYYYKNQVIRQRRRLELEQENKLLKEKMLKSSDQINVLTKQLQNSQASFMLFIHEIQDSLPHNKRIQQLKESFKQNKLDIKNHLMMMIKKEEQKDKVSIQSTKQEILVKQAKKQVYSYQREVNMYKRQQVQQQIVQQSSLFILSKKSSQKAAQFSAHKQKKEQEIATKYKLTAQKKQSLPKESNKSRMKRGQTLNMHRELDRKEGFQQRQIKKSSFSRQQEDGQDVDAALRQRKQMKARIKHSIAYYNQDGKFKERI